MVGGAVFAMLAVGLIPAWKIGRADLALAVRDGGERVTQGLHAARLRYVLLVGQVAGSCLLLVFTAQLARSLQRALDPNPGFEYANVAVIDPALRSHGIDASGANAYWNAVRLAIDAHPETAETAIVSYAPLNGGGGNNRRYGSARHLRISITAVEPAFFSVMRVPIVSGRLFEPSDDPEKTTIISRRAALEMYGTLDVLGQGFPKGDPQRTIVGVAGDAHLINPQATDAAEQYVPIGRGTSGASLLVRARNDPARLLAPLRQAGRAADARVLPEVRLMRDDFARLLRAAHDEPQSPAGSRYSRWGSRVLEFSASASHGARLRPRSRHSPALGAPTGSIVRTLLRSTMWTGATALTLGVIGAAALTERLASRRPTCGRGCPCRMWSLRPCSRSRGWPRRFSRR